MRTYKPYDNAGVESASPRIKHRPPGTTTSGDKSGCFGRELAFYEEIRMENVFLRLSKVELITLPAFEVSR